MIQVAAEVGGTFTDLIWADEEGRVQTQKVPSTPDDPSVGVVEGLNEVMQGGFSQLSQLFQNLYRPVEPFVKEWIDPHHAHAIV